MKTLKEIKEELVAAHWAKDWQRAARLSQEKQRAKRREDRHCVDCGVPVGHNSGGRCRMHAIMHRYYRRSLAGGLAAAVCLLVVTLNLWAGPPGVLRSSVLLEWSYPSNQLSTNLIFKVYQSPDILAPMTNWTVLTNVVGTNISVVIPLSPQVMFFAVTSSNLWGESFFSNVADTPPPPTNGNLSIR